MDVELVQFSQRIDLSLRSLHNQVISFVIHRTERLLTNKYDLTHFLLCFFIQLLNCCSID